MQITKGKDSPEGQMLKEMMRKGTGAKIIREKLREYVDALKKEYASNIILPGKDDKKGSGSNQGRIYKLNIVKQKINFSCQNSL